MRRDRAECYTPAMGFEDRFNSYVRQVVLKREAVPSFQAYPFNIPAVLHLDSLDLHAQVTFIVGENGTGKSTLLEAIAVAAGFNAEGGTRNFNFATQATHADLHEHIRLIRGARRPKDGFFLRAESLYNASTYIDKVDDGTLIQFYGGISLHRRSHGEAFMALMMNRFGGDGLYILDEPEAALSPTRQMAVLPLIQELVRKRSQFIIATHSPILMAFPGARIYVLGEDGITETPYTETEHYRVSRDFFLRTGVLLDELLGD